MKLWEKYKIDLIVDSWDKYRKAILSLLEGEEDAKLLDLGSGEGHFTKRIAEKIGTSHFQGIELNGKVKDTGALPGDLNERFPMGDKIFDVVIASHIIEHLWNTDGFVKEIHRVLKPTGYAIISTPNLAAWHNILYLIFGKQPETSAVSDEIYSWVESPGHRRIFTATELIKFLRFHSFTIETLIGSTYHPLPGGLARIMCQVDWRHASIITVKVRKCPT